MLTRCEKLGAWSQHTLLLNVAAAASWPRARLHDDGLIDSPMCPRCNDAPETLVHRMWQCRCNTDIPDPAMRNSQCLARQALREVGKWP
eukprot:3066999-Alexandrium_andersonii.AAC.1